MERQLSLQPGLNLNTEDAYLTLELTAQALCYLPTYLEPKVFTAVSVS